LAIFAALVTALSMFALAQSAEQQRISNIDYSFDASRGVKLLNPLTGQWDFFKNLTATTGKTAVWECILLGRARTPWYIWWFGDGHGNSRAEAKSCAQTWLVPICAQRKAEIELARQQLAQPNSTGLGGIVSFGSGFILAGLVRANTTLEYTSVAALIDADYWNVGGSYGSLAVPVGQARETPTPDTAPQIR
jgi:hypothetical protein